MREQTAQPQFVVDHRPERWKSATGWLQRSVGVEHAWSASADIGLCAHGVCKFQQGCRSQHGVRVQQQDEIRDTRTDALVARRGKTVVLGVLDESYGGKITGEHLGRAIGGGVIDNEDGERVAS